jgi:hypothetical protein
LDQILYFPYYLSRFQRSERGTHKIRQAQEI